MIFHLDSNKQHFFSVRTRQTSETPRSNKDPPLTPQLHHIHEGEERKAEDDHSDRELDNLDWDVLGHTPNRDTVTECESTGPRPTSLTCEQRLLCPANCCCKNSRPRFAKKSRVVKDYGPRNGNAELNSNTCIAEREIVAVFGETAQSSERRRQYGLKTTFAISNVSRHNNMR